MGNNAKKETLVRCDPCVAIPLPPPPCFEPQHAQNAHYPTYEPGIGKAKEDKGKKEKFVRCDPCVAIPLPPPPCFEQQHAQNAHYPQSESVINVPEYVVNPAAGGDSSDDIFKSFSFDEHTIRRAFVTKVYSLILLQMGITAAFVSWFMFHEPTKYYVTHNMWVIYGALGIYLVTFISMLCCQTPRRKVPYNYIFLIFFTIALSVMVATVTTRYQANEVLMAFGITAVIVFSLTLFACQTKIDFTVLNGSLFVIFLVIILFGIIAYLMRSPTLYLLYCGLGVVFFGIHLVYDTQMIIGGKHKYKISPEEYVFAALTIYLDIINIFLRILRFMR